MSLVYEYVDTRDGDARTADRLDSTRIYVVQLAEVGEGEPTELVEAVVPRGSTHPDSAWKGLLVSGYAKRSTDSALTWYVDIFYATPVRLGLAEWLMRISYNNSTERMMRSLPTDDAPKGKLIGPYAYHPWPEDEMGPGVYETTVFDDANHTYKIIELYRAYDPSTGEAVHKLEGVDRAVPAITITLSRTLTRMTSRIIRNAADYMATVNEKDFFGWGPRTLLLSDMSIDEVDGQVEGQREAGLVYPTSITFSANSDGWTPVTFYDTYIDDKGNESAVIDRSSPREGAMLVKAIFSIYRETHFQNLLTLLEGGRPRTGIGRISR